MTEYRTPEELKAQAEHAARVWAVLSKAVQDAASCKVAMTLGESPEVVDMWAAALYDGLRDNLSDDRPDLVGRLRQEDRLTAIVMLLDRWVQVEHDIILRGLRSAGGGATDA